MLAMIGNAALGRAILVAAFFLLVGIVLVVSSVIQRRQPPRAGVDARALAVLAFAEDPGLPLRLWVRVMGKAPGDASDARWLSRHARQLDAVVERRTEGGRELYSLRDPDLAERLRADQNAVGMHQRFVAALLASVPRDRRGDRAWAAADRYVLDHLAMHALRAGRIEELSEDAGFRAHARPPRFD